ncbi:MAG: peptidylprolyl isomerase [Bryobacteraceae bacterium]
MVLLRLLLYGSAALFALASLCFAGSGGEAHYIGPQACALCHKEIAATQTKTPMATTWHGAVTSSLPLNYEGHAREGSDAAPLAFEVKRLRAGFVYSVALPDGAKVTLPVEIIMGGKRHGLSFLARIEQFDGISLDRPALIEARYVYSSTRNTLVLSPGFSSENPDSYPAAFGEVLSSSLEVKCLACHGKPNGVGAGKEGGVHCESCHGPGSQHLLGISKGNPQQGIINPKRLSAKESLEICAQCHIGFTHISDPLPGDLLVSNQANALRNAECFIQSGEAFACTACHDAHKDSSGAAEATVKTCLGCHSTAAAKPRAAICPINPQDKCIGCHMPSIESGSFHMVDHWIRVHPEQGVQAPNHDETLRSQVQPIREFLRMIVTKDGTTAETASRRLSKGEAFFTVARDLSVDATASVGGYAGQMLLSDMDPKLSAAASKLQYGETSGVIDLGNRRIILYRMPRDFKWEAEQLQEQASALKTRGDLKGALAKNWQALEIYPSFLRGLIFRGVTLGESGDVQHAAEILELATQLYPDDAAAEFNLGLTLGGSGRRAQEIEAYRRAIELQPDIGSVYENLGAALYSAGDRQGAIQVFRQGLQANPLSALLYYDLSLALEQEKDIPGAKRAMALATKLDPDVAHRQQK